MFWTYENWIHQYARAHRSSCPYCRNGKGIHPGSGDQNGTWYGPFESLELARQAGNYSASVCGYCLRDEAKVAQQKPVVMPKTFDPEKFVASVDRFMTGRRHDARYASFDYCFNYFQSARLDNRLDSLLDRDHAEVSCLQLGFYLASWGMFRGRASILQHSSFRLLPVIETLISADKEMWEIDAPQLSDAAPEVVEFADKLGDAFGKNFSASDTLTTKILLGVMGTVPAFDRFFRSGFSVSTFSKSSVRKVGRFYHDHRQAVDQFEIPTLDFHTGLDTSLKYPKSKIIDMGFFISGQDEN